jgi:hypothetical protein
MALGTSRDLLDHLLENNPLSPAELDALSLRSARWASARPRARNLRLGGAERTARLRDGVE